MQHIVRQSFLALYEGHDRRFCFEELKPGHIVSVVHYQDRNGMVEVRYEGRVLTVFMRDIMGKCSRVDAAIST